MALISSLIVIVCSGTVPNYADPCQKALEATTKQTQLYQTDEKLESYASDRAVKISTKVLGQGTMDALGGGAYAYKVYRDRSIHFRLPTFGLCDSASNTIGLDSYSLNLSWHLPK
jgi:hypothetical protein